MDISKIREHVTYLSEELKLKAKSEEEVVVGGQITNMVPPFNDQYPQHLVILDDKVGTLHTLVPETVMQAYEGDFKVGNYIFLEGFAHVMERPVKEGMKKEVSVFAYSVKDITKVGDTI